jgi:pyruvate kinase
MKKTKVICTVGPSSNNKEILRDMIKEGMNVARINLSHSSQKEVEDIVIKIRELNEELNTNVGILLDTKGPEIRIGTIKGGQVKLEAGSEIKINMKPVEGTNEEISVNYSGLVDDVEIKDRILLDDGLIELTVIRKNKESFICRVENDGVLASNKGVNIPGKKLRTCFLSEKDIEDIEFACKMDVDFLALSYTSCAEDILEVNDLLIAKNNNHIQIIAKIENVNGVEELDNIIKVSDGVMVARGDLGVELPLEKLPTIQKEIIEKCHKLNKISIVATQMLLTMQDNPRPSRAEVSDVYNAVLDGADAVMLSGETTIGEYPVEAVSVMSKIAESAEEEIDYLEFYDRALKGEKQDITCAVASGVVDSAYHLKAKAIVAATFSGYTARKLSHMRPVCPVIATSPNEDTARSLSLNWGIYPVVVDIFYNTDDIILNAEQVAQKMLDLEVGDKMIITGGLPLGEVKHTNFMKVVEIK